MSGRYMVPVLTLAAAVAVLAAAARPGLEVTSAAQDSKPDTSGAAVWAFLQEQDYSNEWTLWPGKGKLYEGQEPHGMLLTTYLNDAAAEALERGVDRMPAGAIIVKENYMPDKTLAAVTVMYKVPGYNPDHNDWFFTKHLPGGELDKMPNGMAMEGRLPGCQNCHIAQKNNDYIFTGELSGG
jgi:hypothetical protein